MGSFNRDDNRSGGYRGGFGRGGDRGPSRGGFGRGRSSFGGDRGPREMFKAVCSNCGKECEVPFRPTNGKPVYCSDCFEKMGNGRSEGPRQERSDFRPQAQASNQNNSQLEALNAKLDRIISLLEPKAKEVKEVEHETSAELKEVKAPKAKKAIKKSAPSKK